ncbi:MAG: hypothetical protein IPN06_08000 [Burkholderiales bacterium]|nr:hypothetical protein [Burkholderiales bacterium]
MTMSSVAIAVLRDADQIGLVEYNPDSGDPARVVAVVWRHEKRVHWSSLCFSYERHAFNPQPFMAKYPNGICDVRHFERVMSWFDALCFSAADVLEVQSKCNEDAQLGLCLKQYCGTKEVVDLNKSLEDGVLPVEKMSLEHFRASLVASLEGLVRECPNLRDMSLEVLSTHPYACARLHTPKKKVLVYIDQTSDHNHVVPRLARENAALVRKNDRKAHSLIVFSSMKGDTPVALTPRVTGTGLNFTALSKSLARLTTLQVGKAAGLADAQIAAQ